MKRSKNRNSEEVKRKERIRGMCTSTCLRTSLGSIPAWVITYIKQWVWYCNNFTFVKDPKETRGKDGRNWEISRAGRCGPSFDQAFRELRSASVPYFAPSSSTFAEPKRTRKKRGGQERRREPRSPMFFSTTLDEETHMSSKMASNTVRKEENTIPKILYNKKSK